MIPPPEYYKHLALSYSEVGTYELYLLGSAALLTFTAKYGRFCSMYLSNHFQVYFTKANFMVPIFRYILANFEKLKNKNNVMVLYLSKIKKKEPLSTAQRMKQNEIEKPKKERAL